MLGFFLKTIFVSLCIFLGRKTTPPQKQKPPVLWPDLIAGRSQTWEKTVKTSSSCETFHIGHLLSGWKRHHGLVHFGFLDGSGSSCDRKGLGDFLDLVQLFFRCVRSNPADLYIRLSLSFRSPVAVGSYPAVLHVSVSVSVQIYSVTRDAMLNVYDVSIYIPRQDDRVDAYYSLLHVKMHSSLTKCVCIKKQVYISNHISMYSTELNWFIYCSNISNLREMLWYWIKRQCLLQKKNTFIYRSLHKYVFVHSEF